MQSNFLMQVHSDPPTSFKPTSLQWHVAVEVLEAQYREMIIPQNTTEKFAYMSFMVDMILSHL